MESQRLSPLYGGLFLCQTRRQSLRLKPADYLTLTSIVGDSVQHRCNTIGLARSRYVHSEITPEYHGLAGPQRTGILNAGAPLIGYVFAIRSDSIVRVTSVYTRQLHVGGIMALSSKRSFPISLSL